MIPRPSEREKERRGKREGKLLRRLWTGRCSNFKGPIPIFNLLRGQERRRGGVKANSSSNPRIRILARSWIGPAIFSPKNSISRPTSVPPQLRDFPSRKTYLTSAEYIYPISSWSNEFLESRKRKGREGGDLYRSKYRPTTIRTQRWFGGGRRTRRVNSILRVNGEVRLPPAIPVKLVAADV